MYMVPSPKGKSYRSQELIYRLNDHSIYPSCSQLSHLPDHNPLMYTPTAFEPMNPI